MTEVTPIKNKNPEARARRITFLSIPEKWGERALNVFCVLAVIYAGLAVFFRDSGWMITLETIIGKGAGFVTFSFGTIVIVIHLWDKIMFNYKRVEAAEKRAEAERKRADAEAARNAELEARNAELEARITALEAKHGDTEE